MPVSILSRMSKKRGKTMENKSVINIDTKIIEKAILKNGINIQSIVAMEECSELQKGISKLLRGSGSRTALLEEMADVAICLKQLQLMYNLDDEDLFLTINQKLERLENRCMESKIAPAVQKPVRLEELKNG